MQKFLSFNKRKPQYYLKYLLILLAVVFIVFVIPKRGRFQYEFEKNKPWMHADYFAPFTFPIEKPQEQIEEERQEIKENFKPYYTRNPEFAENKINVFEQALLKNLQEQEDAIRKHNDYIVKNSKDLLQEVYDRGIIAIAAEHQEKPENFKIQVIRKNVAQDHNIGDFFTVQQAQENISKQLSLSKARDTLLAKNFVVQPLLGALDPNITYNQSLSETKLQEELDKVLSTEGTIQENEKIISKGNIVTEEKYKILISVKKVYENRTGLGSQQAEIIIGYFLLVALMFMVFFVYLHLFDNDAVRSLRSIILALINVLIFFLLGLYVVDNSALSIYLVPYCIVPIVLLAFFGSRAAFITYILLILLSGLVVPNAFEFIIIQLVAGLAAIISMLRIRYISQFFLSTVLILITYIVSYLGFNLIQGVSFQEMEYRNLLWFVGNFILTLLAYPLIYAFEKLFGFVSDITLIELSDINRKLLRKLALKAPGTFQHSLQVSHLAETLVNEIGGNALLTRVGALYHDIGKMENAAYFIENQKFLKNPHDYLEEEESARIIIRHVIHGEDLASDYGLPEKVIDFIRTHHGTSRVEYFYRNYLKKNPDSTPDDSVFRYPGPKPFSKETAVVMIVDSIEAASRSLKQVDEDTVEKLVDKIIDGKLEDKQLEDAHITLNEINHIRNRLKKLLKSIYHVRVEYPNEEEN